MRPVDELKALVWEAWFCTGHVMLWPGVDGDPPEGIAPWARVSLQHGPAGQATLAGEDGKRRWFREGALIVQVFTPPGDGYAMAYTLAGLLIAGVQGKSTPSGVWLRNVRQREIGHSGAWLQLNVIADFQYEELA